MPEDKTKPTMVNGKPVDSDTLKKAVEESAGKGPQGNKSNASPNGEKKPVNFNQTARIDPDSRYYVGQQPAKGRELRKWKKRVRAERKHLRSDLKEMNIKKWIEFDRIATDIGLTYSWRGSWLGRLLWWFIYYWEKVRLKALIAAAIALLILLFLWSYLADFQGSFTINLTGDMLRNHFRLFDTIDFVNPESRLISEELVNVNNIDITDIDRDVDLIDGPHNGKNYVAYSFYIKNVGVDAQSYVYSLSIVDSSLGVDATTWVMLFEDGKQIVYAKAPEEDVCEGVTGYSARSYERYMFVDSAYDEEKQYYKDEDGKYGIVATPYYDETTVVKGIVEDMQPDEYKKYTVVIWVEGADADCQDEVMGGFVKYKMEFDLLKDDTRRNLLDGVYRTEYEDYNPYEED